MMYAQHQQVKEAAVENLQRPSENWKERKRPQTWFQVKHRGSSLVLYILKCNMPWK